MALAILVFINLIYAGAPTMMKLAVTEFPPTTLVWLRHTSALLVIIPFALFAKWPQMQGRALARIALATVLAFTITSLLQVVAMQRSTASVGAMIVAMQPLITIGLAGIFLHEHLSPRLWMACMTALCGFAVISGDSILQLEGNLLYVLAIACESSLGIFLRPLLKDHPPLQITLWCLICASLFLLPFQFTDFVLLAPQVSLPAWGSVIYMGVGCSAMGTVLWLISLQKLEVSKVAIAWFLQPVWGSILPVLVLGERMTPNTILGGGLILSAMGIMLWHSHHSGTSSGRLAAHH